MQSRHSFFILEALCSGTMLYDCIIVLLRETNKCLLVAIIGGP